MDERRFDALARDAGREKSRRDVLRGLAGAVFGGLLGRAALQGAEAGPSAEGDRRQGERCNSSNQCQRGFRCCSGRCRDVLNDRRNCGNCGTTCRKDDQVCANGACFDTCRGATNGTCDVSGCGSRCGCNVLEETGDGVCENTGTRCDELDSCNDDGDCKRGEACVNEGCCNGKTRVCVEPCGAASMTVASESGPAATGKRGSRPR